MAYNEILADRLREVLADLPDVEEKKMFRGLTFMVNGKMCICVSGNDLMCRFDPAIHDEVMERNGCRSMHMKGREYRGFCYVSEEGFRAEKDFNYWLKLTLEYNKIAKAAAKKKKKLG